jgi:CubicO group peptidase (beta-lactamase class C family)
VGPDHLFQIGSISKMVAALTAASLIEEGRLSPQMRVEEALRGLKIRNGSRISLRHLLDHTAGLPADSEIFPIGGLQSGFEPGARWSYSNCGYHLAGLMIAAADQRPIADAIEARVLKKLGMTNSVAALRIADRARHAQGYEPALTDRLNLRPGPRTPSPWVDADNAAGSVTSTAGDMARFLRFLIDLADGKGAPVLSDAAAREFLADPVAVPGLPASQRYKNGVRHLEAEGRRYLHHTGGMVSFSSSLHVDREAGVAAFASANVHYSLGYRPRDVTAYACGLMRALAEGGPAPRPRPTAPRLDAPQRFVGRFTAADGDFFEIIAGPDAIRLLRAGRTSRLQLATETLFASEEADFAVTGVAFDLENGKAARAWIGEREYAADPARGYLPPAPEALRLLAGRYDSDDRWDGPLYIYARDGRLFVGNAEPLFPLGPNLWRLGEQDFSPERIAFDGFVNGRPRRLLFSGSPYIRRFS